MLVSTLVSPNHRNRDTFVKDIIEDDKKVCYNKVEETSFDFPNQLNMKDAKSEAIQHTEAAKATLVVDDCNDVIEHKKDDSTAANLIRMNEAIEHTEVAKLFQTVILPQIFMSENTGVCSL